MIENWQVSDVGEWLEEINFGEYKTLFCENHKIDGSVLLTITEFDLRSPPLNMKVLGDIKRLAKSINELKGATNKESRVKSYFYTSEMENNVSKYSILSSLSMFGKTRHRRHSTPSGSANSVNNNNNNNNNNINNNKHYRVFTSQSKLQEMFRVAVSLGYLIIAVFVSAVVMSVAHDKVPDKEKYPPLPDIFLDSVPLIPWAFKAAEICALTLAFSLMILLIFHRYRLIIMRRLFSILGSLFILRCCTMFVTSLSVPGKHLNCTASQYQHWDSRLDRSLEIFRGIGMTLSGVQTCGDYMFSGHTTVITTFNLFLAEYTPRQVTLISTMGWLLNLFGIFFILAAHEHYSIDVLIAFYVTTRLFISYHSFANSRALVPMVWFPMFSYLERHTKGPVPNDYEIPIRIPKAIMHIVNEIISL